MGTGSNSWASGSSGLELQWWLSLTIKSVHGGVLFIGERRGRITYTPRSLSLMELVEFELDSIFR
jgi:hypothetical protein